MRGEIEDMRGKNKELEQDNRDLHSTIEGLLLRKVELEESLKELK